MCTHPCQDEPALCHVAILTTTQRMHWLRCLRLSIEGGLAMGARVSDECAAPRVTGGAAATHAPGEQLHATHIDVETGGGGPAAPASGDEGTRLSEQEPQPIAVPALQQLAAPPPEPYYAVLSFALPVGVPRHLHWGSLMLHVLPWEHGHASAPRPAQY
jgi:hypothetical protein